MASPPRYLFAHSSQNFYLLSQHRKQRRRQSRGGVARGYLRSHLRGHFLSWDSLFRSGRDLEEVGGSWMLKVPLKVLMFRCLLRLASTLA